LPHRLIAFPRYILYQRQQPLELWRLGDGYVVAESEDLIADTLESVAEPSAINH
jgi:hypothetical protein